MIVSVRAQLPAPELRSIFPAGGQRGTEFEVEVKGENLDDPDSLIFSHPGITGVTTESVPSPLSGKIWKDEGRYRVSIAADVPVGLHTVRMAGKYGVSAARAFAVGALPEIRELAAGAVFEKNVIFNGRGQGREAATFLMHLKAGEKVEILCEAGAIDSMLEPALQINSPDGRNLATAVGGARKRTARLSFVADADGVYSLLVWDYVFRGGNDCAFRLQWGNEATTGLKTVELMWPEGAGGGTHRGDFADGKPDEYLFTARKGQVFWLEAVSERLGYPTDLEMSVFKGDQKVAGADDVVNTVAGIRLPLSTRDPALRFTAGEDGEYRVVLRDQFAAGAQSPYELVISEPVTDFQMIALPGNPYDDEKQTWNISPVVERNAAIRYEVYVFRRGGFDGEIELTVDGLPDGVTVEGELFVSTGVTWATILLRVDRANENWLGPITIRGRAGGIERIAYGVRLAERVSDYNRAGPDNRLHNGHMLQVMAADAPLQVSAPKGEVFISSLGGTIEIPVALARTAGFNFKNGVSVKPVELSGLKVLPELKMADDASEGVLKLSIVNKGNNVFAAGMYQFGLRADAVLSFEAGKEEMLAAEALKKEAETVSAELEVARKAAEAERNAVASGAKEALEMAEKKFQDATERKRLGDEETRLFTERAAKAAERAKARDLKYTAWSSPITLILAEVPLNLISVEAAPNFLIGSDDEAVIEIERLFGFDGDVEIVPELPDDVRGFVDAPAVKIAKDQTSGVVKFGIKAEAAAGDYRGKLRLKMNFGGQEVSMAQEILLHVVAAGKEVTDAVAP